MNSNERFAGNPESEISLMAILQVLWRYKYWVMFISGAGGFIAIVLALTATPVYRAEVAVIEVGDEGMGGAASLANQLGGLASLAGVNLRAGSSRVREAQATLKSRHLIEEFISRNKLLDELSADKKLPPTVWRAVQQFQRTVLSIREDKRSGITSIAIEWTDPKTAARWANEFVALANGLVRTRALEESKWNIAYLSDQIGQTNGIELRKVIYNIIENETKNLMLAKGRVEYAFQVVDPAVPPEVRIRPKRTLMVLAGVILGLFTGAGVALMHNELGRRRRGFQQGQ